MSTAVSSYRIQYQKGLGLFEFQKRFGTEDQCKSALKSMRWPDGFICPACSGRTCWILARPMLRCKDCRTDTSLTAGTLFHSTKLPLTVWFLAIYLFTQTKTGMSALEMKRHLGVNEKTAMLIQHKLMETMRNHELGRQLKGTVEIGTGYVEMPHHSVSGTRTRRKRTPFILAVQTANSGGVSMAIVEPVSTLGQRSLDRWQVEHLAPGTDTEFRRIKGNTVVAVSRSTLLGDTVSANGKERSSRFFWVETLFSNLKTALAGVRHQTISKYLSRFLALFQFRLNHRFELARIATQLLKVSALSIKRPRRVLLPVENAG